MRVLCNCGPRDVGRVKALLGHSTREKQQGVVQEKEEAAESATEQRKAKAAETQHKAVIAGIDAAQGKSSRE
eukprot:1161582-Pelagomonas_calceolata.AAC.1